MSLACALILAAATPEAQLAAIERDVRAQEARLAAAQAPLAALLARVQRIALRPSGLSLVDARSARDMVRTRVLLASLRPMIDARTAALRRQMIVTGAARAELAQAVAARAEERDRFGSLDQAGLNRRLGALPAPAPGPLPHGQPVYALPAAGRVVIGTGDRGPDGIAARGLTLATASGATVSAPAAGRIAYAGPFRGYGDIVLIDHGGGWTTLLAGLSLATAASGERIGQGATLGQMARDTPRLTIELRHRGRAIDVAAMAAQRR
jgi:septal ring factor EnvC (AmiA/AmiB activator)